MKLENIIYCGDNLIWLRQFPDKLIDLIYLDPPFFSNRHFEVIFNDGEEIRSFQDRWQGGINHYIEWMKERVFELHRILKDTGSFYLHCDWHASHYLKIMCDDIFGYNKFKNEIIWKRATMSGAKAVGRQYGRNHDVILYYTKTDKYTYNTYYLEYSQDYIKKKFVYKEPDGRIYRLQPKGTRSNEAMVKLKEQNRVVVSKTGYEEIKFYLNDMKGVALDDVWIDIKDVRTIQSNEKLNYPTQKPEGLMERIIQSSANKNDLILDPFCGCGTTVAVAQRLQRKWVGIDVSPTACKLMKNRVEKNGARGVEIIGLPINIEDLKRLPAFEFQNWCVGALGGTVNSKKVGDMGIDGFTFFNRYPIQVKQSENIGRNVVDNFETALQRDKKDRGYIIALSFGKGAYEEVARIKKEGLFIELLTVDKLLGFSEEKVSDKMFEFY